MNIFSGFGDCCALIYSGDSGRKIEGIGFSITACRIAEKVRAFVLLDFFYVDLIIVIS